MRRLHYGAQLESSTYQHNTADYLYMYLVGMAAMDVRSIRLLPSVTFDALHFPGPSTLAYVQCSLPYAPLWTAMVSASIAKPLDNMGGCMALPLENLSSTVSDVTLPSTCR